MYRKILVPMALDHGLSPQTLAIANALKAEGGEVIALHVHETAQGSMRAYIDENLLREGFERARALLAEKLREVDGVEGRIEEGHTARTILDHAAEHDFDCIVIGSHKPDISDYLLGSTASRVVRHAACAVHVHRNS